MRWGLVVTLVICAAVVNAGDWDDATVEEIGVSVDNEFFGIYKRTFRKRR